MANLDSSAYRRQNLPPTTPHRRATVGSPPQFSFTNTFESQRPPSRAERLSDFPYRTRRSTVSGQAQGHNVNGSGPFTAYDDVMLSDSASSSPIMSHAALFPGPCSTLSAESPRPSPVFDYERPAFSNPLHSPLQSSFSLCPSPDFPNHLNYPRFMPPPLLPADFSFSVAPAMRPIPSSSSGANTTPALSPTASSNSFPIDPTLDASDPSSPRLVPDPALATMTREQLEAEIMNYRQCMQNPEVVNPFNRLRILEMEAADNKARMQNELRLFASEPFPSSSTEQWIPPPDWRARKEARIRQYCALNRAGNASCAWHDSRRERRAHPPRMAPPNTLNCGCTFDEALFEESLARNHVGAFHPGESVRMDPALRNPLLKLLQERYGYQDGDFERLPDGTWKEGQDVQSWEQRVAAARASSKRDRR